MGRIATAQGGNNPTTHKCGICGEEGHYRTTCPLAQDNGGGFCLPATRPLPRKGTYKCGHCGKVGHNKRTCPTLKADPVEQKFELELTGLLTDEAPMESDVELTPTPRSEVDVATEGYQADWGNLPQECLDIILAEVERHNQEYWENAIHITNMGSLDKSKFHLLRRIKSSYAEFFAPASAIQVIEVDRNINEGYVQEKLCKDIRTVFDIRGERFSASNRLVWNYTEGEWVEPCLKPSTLKYKYIRKEIGTPDFRYFKKSLAERAENRRRAELARMER